MEVGRKVGAQHTTGCTISQDRNNRRRTPVATMPRSHASVLALIRLGKIGMTSRPGGRVEYEMDRNGSHWNGLLPHVRNKLYFNTWGYRSFPSRIGSFILSCRSRFGSNVANRRLRKFTVYEDRKIYFYQGVDNEGAD